MFPVCVVTESAESPLLYEWKGGHNAAAARTDCRRADAEAPRRLYFVKAAQYKGEFFD